MISITPCSPLNQKQNDNRLKLIGAAAHESQCPSQYSCPLDAEVHEQKFRSGGQSEARPPVFKSPSKLGTHLSTHCSRDERIAEGRSSQVVQVSDLGWPCHEFEPSTTKDPTRVGQRCTLNRSRAETSSHWCGVVVRRGGASSDVTHVT
ncbi:uncharacterized protein TNCV_4144701 [Trichonephila clavipes]|nr:uncharacterized protein TNCV_4144701 [Trichonephila clavipes]